jgi:branched-chain amino acid transport system substrate-binding protein
VRRQPLTAALLASLVWLLGCSSSSKPGDKIPGATLTIYSSLPLEGSSSADAAAVLRGESAALAQLRGRVGSYRIVLRPLDDSTPQRGGWDPGQTTQNARLAVSNPTTIGYLGEFNSGASAISIPLLNRLGIPQISPGSSAVGLTTGGVDASPGEPEKYYPTGARTFARVVPSDRVQAAAQLRLERGSGCRQTYVLDDSGVDGQDAAESFERAATAAGLLVPAVTSFDARANDYSALATTVAQSGADCVLVSATNEGAAAAVIRQVAAAAPTAKLFGSAGVADVAFTDPARGGIPLALDPHVLLAAPPHSYEVYGYEAMSLMLGAIARATDRGTKPARRSKVLAALFHTGARRSALGPYRIDAAGDTTLLSYGVYRVVRGKLMLWQTLAAG